MDSSREEVQGAIDKLKNMVSALLYSTQEQSKALKIQEDQLYFFQEELERGVSDDRS